MHKIWTLILLSFLLLACQSGNGDEPLSLTNVKFQCEQLDADPTIPKYVVYLAFNQDKISIARSNACTVIEPAEYATYQIPANAQDACGGWWAGSGDYFYLIPEQGQYEIFQTTVYEEGPPGYPYKKIATLLPSGQLQLEAELDSLAGVYVLHAHDGARLISLTVKDRQLEGLFYSFDGMLPPVQDLKDNPDQFKPVPVTLHINPYDLSFHSSLGEGQFNDSELIFFEQEGTIDSPLTLVRDAQYDPIE